MKRNMEKHEIEQNPVVQNKIECNLIETIKMSKKKKKKIE